MYPLKSQGYSKRKKYAENAYILFQNFMRKLTKAPSLFHFALKGKDGPKEPKNVSVLK